MAFLACEKNHMRDVRPRELGRPPKHWQAMAGGVLVRKKQVKRQKQNTGYTHKSLHGWGWTANRRPKR